MLLCDLVIFPRELAKNTKVCSHGENGWNCYYLIAPYILIPPRDTPRMVTKNAKKKDTRPERKDTLKKCIIRENGSAQKKEIEATRKAERNLCKVSYHTIYFYTKINNMNTKCFAILLFILRRNFPPPSLIIRACASLFFSGENNAKRLLKAAQALEKKAPSTRRARNKKILLGFTVDLPRLAPPQQKLYNII